MRPASLAGRYQRGYSEETQSLLLGLLSSSRSFSAAREALHKSSEQELEKIAAGFIEELDLPNTRPLDPDLLALFFDGKYVEVKEGDRLKTACIYLAHEISNEEWDRTINVNLRGYWLCAQFSIPQMLSQKSGNMY